MLVAKYDDPGASRQRGGSHSAAEQHHSLANIRRVLWGCHRNGLRSDGTIENLGMIREPAEEELV